MLSPLFSIQLLDGILYNGIGGKLGNIDREKPCPECGEVSILDGEARICYECWQMLVLAEAEEE